MRKRDLEKRVAKLEETVSIIDQFLMENEPADLLKQARLDAQTVARQEMKRVKEGWLAIS